MCGLSWEDRCEAMYEVDLTPPLTSLKFASRFISLPGGQCSGTLHGMAV